MIQAKTPSAKTAGATNFGLWKCEPYQKFRLVLVVLDRTRKRGHQGHRRHEMLRIPARIPDLGRNMQNQQVEIDANSSYKAADRAVLQFRGIGRPRGTCDVSRNDRLGDRLTEAAKRIPDYASSHIRARDLRRKAVLGEERELPRAGCGGRVGQNVDSANDAAILKMPVQGIEFHTETEWQMQFGRGSDDVAIGCSEVP